VSAPAHVRRAPAREAMGAWRPCMRCGRLSPYPRSSLVPLTTPTASIDELLPADACAVPLSGHSLRCCSNRSLRCLSTGRTWLFTTAFGWRRSSGLLLAAAPWRVARDQLAERQGFKPQRVCRSRHDELEVTSADRRRNMTRACAPHTTRRKPTGDFRRSRVTGRRPCRGKKLPDTGRPWDPPL